MLAAEREDLILAAVREHGTVRLQDLVVRLGVTAVTVRRDVTRLADRGLLTRVHGGVALPRRLDRPPTTTTSRPGARTSRTFIGMVVPSMEYYWPAVVRGAQMAVADSGDRLALRGSSYDPDDNRRQLTRLVDQGVQALLAVPTLGCRTSIDLLRWLGTLPIPVVLLERTPPAELPTLAVDAVVTDHALGAGLAVRHLAALGHRRIGLLTARPSPTTSRVRAGWSQTVAELGIDTGAADLDIPPYGAAGWREAYDEVIETLVRGHTRAVVVHSDTEGIGIIERARDLGLSVPTDLAVVSYDDEVASAADPPLTAVRPDKFRLGAVAAELALTRAAAATDRPVHRITLWPQVMVRGSCGAAGDQLCP
ncbi:substrate-binding domain-containing protein [Williamsia sp. CHRR-6]|uniref:substrate-binding domain-containing protein n=1 Tax=Williamsia sp. CHRR-6 TaxID=2835871 RepID=UPI001BD97C90|nr:substrate-binding domain-containing protein [Williamsia sp. CHRR-6]MBT0567067.1 DeoR/GlpR family transcriptional regulator [Williamsia sp. CHRR-6]